MNRPEQPTYRITYRSLALALTPDGIVYCETDQTILGPADDYLELSTAVDAHVAAAHTDLTPNSTDLTPNSTDLTPNSTDLDGADTVTEGERIRNPAEFAAYWNRLDTEQRTEVLARINRSAETAARCFLMNHDGYREQLARVAQTLTAVRERCHTIALAEDAADAERDLADEILTLTDPDR